MTPNRIAKIVDELQTTTLLYKDFLNSTLAKAALKFSNVESEAGSKVGLLHNEP
jgi:hypothetical protein